MSLFLNGTEFNDIMFNSVNTTGMFNGTTVWGSSPVYTLTLQNDGHGTLTADKITGKAGDTVILSPTYNTYYRFSGYNITGGSVVGNTFTFGENDATAQATFKVNTFTATGGFEKGSNVSALGNSTVSIGTKYIVHNAHTGDIPTTWYNTSNRWKPNDASAYSLTINGKFKISAYSPSTAKGYIYATGCIVVGGDKYQTAGIQAGPGNGKTAQYSKSYATTTQNVNYGISGVVKGGSYVSDIYTRYTRCWYIATGTVGTWTATGYAP